MVSDDWASAVGCLFEASGCGDSSTKPRAAGGLLRMKLLSGLGLAGSTLESPGASVLTLSRQSFGLSGERRWF